MLTAAVQQGDFDQVLAQINVCCPPGPAKITTETLLDYLEGYNTEDTLLASIRLENLSFFNQALAVNVVHRWLPPPRLENYVHGVTGFAQPNVRTKLGAYLDVGPT